MYVVTHVSPQPDAERSYLTAGSNPSTPFGYLHVLCVNFWLKETVDNVRGSGKHTWRRCQEAVVPVPVLLFITKPTSECPWVSAFLLTQDDLLGLIEPLHVLFQQVRVWGRELASDTSSTACCCPVTVARTHLMRFFLFGIKQSYLTRLAILLISASCWALAPLLFLHMLQRLKWKRLWLVNGTWVTN